MLLSITDYLLQGTIVLLVFVHPWLLRPGRGARAFGYTFFAVCGWGLWRILYFDPATKNDVPGFGYFACAFFYALLSWGFFGLGSLIRKLRARRLEARNA